jgi:hypothetical protein
MTDDRDPPVTHETTVINTGGRSGGGGIIAIVALLVVVIVCLVIYFGGFLHRVERAADKVNLNVNVAVPKVELPDIHIDTNRNQAATANQSGGK